MTGRKSAFVLMPFGDRYDSYYSCIFKPSLEAFGYSVTRGDEFSVPQRPIIQDITDAIIQSDLLLCDISEENPNVLYELGLAHAVGKPVILLSQKKENIPFDLRHLRMITYDYTLPGWESKLTENIKSAARVLESSREIWPTPLLPQAEELRTLGIKRIFRQRKDASPITEALFKDVTGGESPKMVQMMGQSLAWLKDKGNELLSQLLNMGCRFQFLLLDPKSKIMKIRTSQENPDLKNECEGFIRWIHQSFEVHERQIEIRLHDLIPTMGMTIIDNHTLYVTPYAMTQRSHSMPMLILKKGGVLFAAFSCEFERVWKKGYSI